MTPLEEYREKAIQENVRHGKVLEELMSELYLKQQECEHPEFEQDEVGKWPGPRAVLGQRCVRCGIYKHNLEKEKRDA